jgi:hypothetical protein
MKLDRVYAPLVPKGSSCCVGRIIPRLGFGHCSVFWNPLRPLQVPVEMAVLSSQPFSSQNGIVDATDYGNLPAARRSQSGGKSRTHGGSDVGAVRSAGPA